MAGYMTTNESPDNTDDGSEQPATTPGMDSGNSGMGGTAMFPEGGGMTGTAPMPKDAPLYIHDRPLPPQQQQQKDSGAGGILGGIGSVISKIIPFFAEGGPVIGGYAKGGSVTGGGNEQHNKALAMGYTVGALHEKKYGGRPDALAAAAHEAKSLLSGQPSPDQGFAKGGQVVGTPIGLDETKQAENAIMQSLGLMPDGSIHMPQQQQAQDQGQAGQGSAMQGNPPNEYIEPPGRQQTPNAMNAGQDAQPQGNSMAPNTPQPTTPLSDEQDQQQEGYMHGGLTGMQQGYAMGGMPMQAQNPAMPAQANMGAARPAMPSQAQNPTMPTQSAYGQGMRRGFADGGMEQKPLAPGQPFMGDGKVVGPGGPSDDAIPAKLSNGEYVISAPAVKFFGVQKFEQMNQKGKEGYMQATAAHGDPNQMPQQGAPPPQAGTPTPGAPPGAPPSPPPPAGPPPGPPMQARRGGLAMSNTKQGYCGVA